MRILCAGLVAGLALLGAASSQAATPSLYFHYAANCTFSIVDDSGNPVSTIAPGAYQVVVDSPFAFSSEGGACSYAQFQLTGPGGVSVTTTLGTGDSEIELFTVTLLPSSTYTAMDNNNPGATRRTFTTAAGGTPTQVAAGGSGSSSSSSSSSSKGTASGGKSSSPIGTALPGATLRGTLVATVKPNGTVTLTKNGKPVQSLSSGRYTFTILDESGKSGFTVQAIRSDPIIVTSPAFVGKRSKALTLNRGQWLFYGTFVGKKTYFLVTA
jgi:hypothetical protein